MANEKNVDDPLLDEFQKRCQAVCDLVKYLVHNEDVTGFYLFGPRGCGKTIGIARALSMLDKQAIELKGTATGEGLFEIAKNNSGAILWFNDDPRLLKDNAAQQYLLAMLEGSSDPKTGEETRIVTKTRKKGDDQFEFTGKLIFDSNLPLGNRPILQAVQDRMLTHHYGPKENELAAVMLYLAGFEAQDPKDQYTMIRPSKKEWKNLYEKTLAAERKEIAEFIIARAISLKRPLTLRMFRDTMRYFIDAKILDLKTSWKDYVIKQLVEHDVPYKYTEKPTRDQRLDSERKELQIILEDADDLGGELEKNMVQEMWMDSTGQNQRQFFRRLNELPENITHIYESLPDGRSS